MGYLCDKVKKLSAKFIDEPRRLYSRVKEDPWYFVSVGSAFIVPTLAAGISAYLMDRAGYEQETITKSAIWIKNAGFFVVNVPMHLYTHRKKLDSISDYIKEGGTILSSNLLGLIVNTIAQPEAHELALNYGIKDPWAVLLTYPPVGGAVTYAKVLYDDFMGAVGLKKKST